MSGTSFGTFWDFLTIFEQFSFFHWKSMIFRKNSKNPYFDLWDLLWWVFHMVLALNHWFRPKNEGSKKSVPQNCKSAGSDALNRLKKFFNCLNFFQLVKNHWLFRPVFTHGRSLCQFIKKILFKSIISYFLFDIYIGLEKPDIEKKNALS